MIFAPLKKKGGNMKTLTDQEVFRQAMGFIHQYMSGNFPQGIPEAGRLDYLLSDGRKIIRTVGSDINNSDCPKLETTEYFISDEKLKPYVERLLKGQTFILTTGGLIVKFSLDRC